LPAGPKASPRRPKQSGMSATHAASKSGGGPDYFPPNTVTSACPRPCARPPSKDRDGAGSWFSPRALRPIPPAGEPSYFDQMGKCDMCRMPSRTRPPSNWGSVLPPSFPGTARRPISARSELRRRRDNHRAPRSAGERKPRNAYQHRCSGPALWVFRKPFEPHGEKSGAPTRATNNRLVTRAGRKRWRCSVGCATATPLGQGA